ncbi:MAG: sulfatase [Bacteroidales bacterium]|nr:sulfatase [Bacteroidales bacterium]
MKNLKLFLHIIGIVLLTFTCNNDNSEKLKLAKLENSKPRNVIFILSDDHRYDYMGFTGKVPWLETPSMDKLASDGVYCRNAYVTTSLCSPSRASILTGQYAHTHTIVDNQAPDPDNIIYFPQYIKQLGYKTAFFGKWHMGDANDNPRPGFDHWESFKGQGEYYNPSLNINGKRVQYDDSSYVTDILTEHALQWMKERTDGLPYFVYLSHKAVHAEFIPAKKHRDKYAKEEIYYPLSYNITKPENLQINDMPYEIANKENPDYNYGPGRIPDWVKEQRYSWHGVDYMYNGAMKFEEFYRRYCETLLGLDESIGKIIDYLKETGQYESTLIIYMGDNGFSFGEHGLIDKRHFYEESTRVPLLVSCPELFKGGKVETGMIQNLDIAPTILEIFGLETPEQMQGKSFVPLLEGKKTEWRDKVFYEYYWEENFPETPTTFGIRTDRYKYIRYWGIWDTNEFYDLESDPYEMNNLIDSPEHQEIIKEMVDELYSWLDETGGMQIPLKRPEGRRFAGDYRNTGQY